MRMILIWGGMFHVKHSPKKMWSPGLTTPDRRAGASAKVMCKTEGVARAIMSAKAMNVKSFLRGCTKFF